MNDGPEGILERLSLLENIVATLASCVTRQALDAKEAGNNLSPELIARINNLHALLPALGSQLQKDIHEPLPGIDTATLPS